MERNSLLESKGWLGRGGRSKRKWLAHYSLVSFFSSYNVWFCLFAFNVFITYRLSCGTIKTEFYFQPGGGGGGGAHWLGFAREQISIELKETHPLYWWR